MKSMLFLFATLASFNSFSAGSVCSYAMIDMYGNYPYEEFHASGINACDKAYIKCDRQLKSRGLDGIAICQQRGRGIFKEGTIGGLRYELPREGGIRIYFGK